jgi:raffinose/stachyose/melibiose transport system permease protein
MKKNAVYSIWFAVPALVVFSIFFVIPMLISFFFSLTVWNLKSFTFCGFDNFRLFFTEHSMNLSVRNTFVYAAVTCSAKLILSFFIAILLSGSLKTKNILRSIVFFPTLVSTIAVGITFSALMHPSKGLFNILLQSLGIAPVDWLGNTKLALLSVAFTDVWKGVGVATVIFLAGIQSISRDYYEAAVIDGANYMQQIYFITLPLSKPARNSIIILALIGGLKSFDLIWTMTGGGPGFATDVLASVIYKQYAAGFYGLSTAGNVIMFIFITVIVLPLQQYLIKKEEQ